MNFGVKKLAALCLLSARLCATETPLTFVAITPCRVVDTRTATGDLGGPSCNPEPATSPFYRATAASRTPPSLIPST